MERPFDYPGSLQGEVPQPSAWDPDYDEIDSNSTDEDFWYDYQKCMKGKHLWGSHNACETCGFHKDTQGITFRHVDWTGVAWRKFACCQEHFHCDLAHMVGDDKTFHVDRHDLVPIDDDDYCSGCGQIGCTHG